MDLEQDYIQHITFINVIMIGYYKGKKNSYVKDMAHIKLSSWTKKNGHSAMPHSVSVTRYLVYVLSDDKLSFIITPKSFSSLNFISPPNF